MELLSELAQRKALIAAALLFALGAGVLGQTILEYMAPPTAPPAATTEFVVDEEFTEETGGRAAAERPQRSVR
jgi:competence protein ComEA